MNNYYYSRSKGTSSVKPPNSHQIYRWIQGKYDLVILLTKQLHTEQALEPFIPLLGQQGVVCTLQNGTPEDRVAALVGAGRTLSGNVMFAGELIGPGESLLNSPLDFVQRHAFDIGELDGRRTERTERIAQVLSSVGRCAVVTNILGTKWSKLTLNNTISSLSAGFSQKVDELAGHPSVARAAIMLLDETIRAANAHGINVEAVEGIPAELLTASGPSTEEDRLKYFKQLAGLYPGAVASMLQDMRRGAASEKDFIPGRVIQVAEQHGVEVPVTRLVYELIDEAESNGVLPDFDRSLSRLEDLLAKMDVS